MGPAEAARKYFILKKEVKEAETEEAAVVVPSVALSVMVVVSVPVVSVPVVVSGIPNSCCAKAKEGYCCPSIALDAKLLLQLLRRPLL